MKFRALFMAAAAAACSATALAQKSEPALSSAVDPAPHKVAFGAPQWPAAGEPDFLGCPPTLITSALGSSTPDYPSYHGVQTGRLFRDGVPDTCAAPGVPGTPIAGSYAFDAYIFWNSGTAPACVQFDINTACTGTNFVYAGAYLGQFDPANITTNNIASIGGSPNPDASMSFIVPGGAYFTIVVSEVTAGAGCGSYSFRMSGLPCTLPCPPAVIPGTLGSGSTAYPGFSGVQNDRLTRDGVPSACSAPKACPGAFLSPGARDFDAYRFTNPGNTPACVTVSLTTNCGTGTGLFAAAYAGSSYNPAALCSGYVADTGLSTAAATTPVSMSFIVPAKQTFTVVVSEVDSANTCVAYNLSITGLPCQPCPPAAIVSSGIGNNASYPARHGAQNDRLFRDGIPSVCGTAKLCPGAFGSPGVRKFDAYYVQNLSGAAVCANVVLKNTCGSEISQFMAAYSNSYDPANLCTNYLADSGSSPLAGGTVSMAFDLAPGAVAIVVVSEVNTGAACSSYELAITGVPCASCYVNCDGSTAAPILNVNDFICFQQRFAAGDPYANCDASVVAPVLNVNDFICFQTKFAQGCN